MVLTFLISAFSYSQFQGIFICALIDCAASVFKSLFCYVVLGVLFRLAIVSIWNRKLVARL